MAALLAWMKAKNELDAAENELRSRDQNALVRRMRAESSHTSAMLKDLSSQMNELDLVCAQIVEARTELARRDGGTGTSREIDLLRKETDDVRRLLSGGAGAIQSRYEAETTRLTSEVNDPSQLKKRFTSDLEAAKRERDRLRTQVGPK